MSLVVLMWVEYAIVGRCHLLLCVLSGLTMWLALNKFFSSRVACPVGDAVALGDGEAASPPATSAGPPGGDGEEEVMTAASEGARRRRF